MTQPTPTPPAQPVIPEKLKEDLTKVLDVHCASAFSRDCAVENVLDAIQPYLAPDAQRVAELEAMLSEAIQLIDDRIEGDPGDEQGTMAEWAEYHREQAAYSGRVGKLKDRCAALSRTKEEKPS